MAQFEKTVRRIMKKDLKDCTDAEIYASVLTYVKEKAAALPVLRGKKKLYYISAEFLLGRLLSNNLINLGLYDEVQSALQSAGKSMAAIEAQEVEPSLGNGGLGRLAACFLDSLATLGLPGDGIGLNYHFGLFRQFFWEKKQLEETNPWITPTGWLVPTPVHFTVQLGRHTLAAKLYDIDVIGYQNGVTKLHLFDLETVDESIVTGGIDFDKRDIPHNLTLFLYPDDGDNDGKLLRVYQEYFMVSCAAQLILKELDDAGHPLTALPEHAVIQINDTHPSMIIPELIRLLMARGIVFDEALALVRKTCAYTNHTILAEALETWPVSFIDEVAPQLMPIIRRLDAQAKTVSKDPKTAILKDSIVHMAHMDIHYSFSVNGVAAIHTRLLQDKELHAFYKLYPEKFNNKTNGITFRRWLMHCNRPLAGFITSLIGEEWITDAMQLEKLLPYVDDGTVQDRMAAIKRDNKRALTQYLLMTQGINLHEEAIFDIQIKRFHEYKRQQMNALHAIHRYLQLKKGHYPPRPLTMIFGGKAAASYQQAKDFIHLILCLQSLIAQDTQVSPWLQVVMVENYNVTLAEKLIPACDLSEQISLASKEASGTGNMKLMLNGALTLGTRDGANVEIHELVGDDNIYLFGKTDKEVTALEDSKTYRPGEYYADGRISELVDFIVSPQLRAIGDTNTLLRIYKYLLTSDPYMTLLDLSDYINVKDWACGEYEDRKVWTRKMLVNTAKAGYFSSDRTITDYNTDLWGLTRDQGMRLVTGGRTNDDGR